MIRAQSFSDKWPITTLGEVVDFLDHRRKPVTASDRVEGEYYYYGANGVQGTINDYIFDEPLVLLAEDGGHFGNPDRTIAYIVEGKYWVNNHAHVLKPKDGLDLHYLCRVLEKYDVTAFIKGATRAKLSKTDASRIPFPLPPLPIQKQIAAALVKADTLRSQCKQMEQELNQLAQSVFLEMFGDYRKVGNNKLPLGDVADVCSGVTKGQNLDGKKTVVAPYMRVANVQDGYIDLSEIKKIEAKLSDYEKYRLEVGDILLTEGGDFDKLGRGAVWEGKVANCIHQNHVFRVRLNEDYLPKYFEYLLQTPYAKQYFLKCAKKTTNLASINITQLKAFPVPKEAIENQQRFVDFILLRDKKMKSLMVTETEYNDLFNSLMQRAFKGQLTLTKVA